MAARRQDAASERLEQAGDLRADAPVADDPDRQLGELPPAQRLPGPLALELEELRKPSGDGQRHHHDVLGDRLAEDAAGVRDGQPALADRRDRDAIHAGRGRVDPSQLRRAGEDVVQDRCRDRAEEEDVGLGEDRLVGVAVDAPVGGEPLATDALGLDTRDELSRQGRAEDRRGEDRRWLAQEPPPGSSSGGDSARAIQRSGFRISSSVGQHLRSGPDPVQEGAVARRG